MSMQWVSLSNLLEKNFFNQVNRNGTKITCHCESACYTFLERNHFLYNTNLSCSCDEIYPLRKEVFCVKLMTKGGPGQTCMYYRSCKGYAPRILLTLRKHTQNVVLPLSYDSCRVLCGWVGSICMHIPYLNQCSVGKWSMYSETSG